MLIIDHIRNKLKSILKSFLIYGGFDPDLYLALYPDVLNSKMNPLLHYIKHGRYEGRIGKCQPVEFIGSLAEIKPDKETILIVSHDASLSGAPVLSLSLTQRFCDKYYVVVLLLGKGTLTEAFRSTGATVAVAPCARNNPVFAEIVLRPILNSCKFKYALVNSIESRSVLPTLRKYNIPSISLFHEFSAQRPKNAFTEAITWSTEVVFSTNITRDDICSMHPNINPQQFHIIPQGRCQLPKELIKAVNLNKEQEDIKNKVRPLSAKDMFVVLGAGAVELRKGLDLFIECAACLKIERPDLAFRFIWIGHCPSNQLDYHVFIEDQIKRAQLENIITIVPETPAIQSAYEKADLFLLTSRLDPLPNLAIEAFFAKLPLVCFDKTSGIVDFLTQTNVSSYCVAKYLNCSDMAKKVAVMSDSADLREQIGLQLYKNAIATFNMDNYIQSLDKLAVNAKIKLDLENKAIETIKQSGLLVTEYLNDDAIQHYVMSWKMGASNKRKPFPGFHPGIYLESMQENIPAADPLTAFILSKQPIGAWNKKVIYPIFQPIQNLPNNKKVAIHIHAYYPELFEDIFNRIVSNQIRPDLFISVKNEKHRGKIQRALVEYEGTVNIQIVPNRGRDIGPFLTAFGWEIFSNYEFIGHIHTKVSADISNKSIIKIWNDFLLENLLGNSNTHMADTILSFMMENPSVGMVYPDDPCIIGWGDNKPYAELLAKKLCIKKLSANIDFPIGSMFFARSTALKPLFKLHLDWSDYPEEPLAYDGSLLHAIERMFPYIVESQNMKCAVTHVPGITR
ncbi:MAG: rhamnan synthesis F family protein [Legionellales bacterium]|jgi:glycosyltransferase involved in cell wall biosynthesis